MWQLLLLRFSSSTFKSKVLHCSRILYDGFKEKPFCNNKVALQHAILITATMPQQNARRLFIKADDRGKGIHSSPSNS